MSRVDNNFDDINWVEVILKLNAFTHKLTKNSNWFRGNSDSFLMGKEVNDYVNDAIEKYLKNPEKYNPLKGDLIKYLCWNIIRTLVGNDLRSKENKTTLDILNNSILQDDDSDSLYEERNFPLIETFFDQNIDYSNIIAEINNDLAKDEIAENIYMCERNYGMKRREIIQEFNYTDSDYDNGKRRMQTILNRIAHKFQIQTQNL